MPCMKILAFFQLQSQKDMGTDKNINIKDNLKQLVGLPLIF